MTDIFSPTALRTQVDRELAKIDPGHGNVELRVTWPDGKVTMVLATRVRGPGGTDWVIRGGGNWSKQTGLGAEIEVLGSW